MDLPFIVIRLDLKTFMDTLFTINSSAQFSSSLDRLGSRKEMRNGSTDFFKTGGPCEWFWHEQRQPLFDVVHPTVPLPITASAILQGDFKDEFGEAVVSCDMSEPCKFPSPDSYGRVQTMQISVS